MLYINDFKVVKYLNHIHENEFMNILARFRLSSFDLAVEGDIQT